MTQSHRRRSSSAKKRSDRAKQLGIESLESRCLLDAKLLITEFSAANDNGIRDDDGDRSDWIEIHNAGDESANLDGWFLTDNSSELKKWRIPPTELGPGGYEIVFASGKDRVGPDGELHTDFRLGKDGEYLALVEPDGETMASLFADQTLKQIDDYSFGFPQEVISQTVLELGATSTTFIPADDSLGTTWTEQDFDDSQWDLGTTGIGFGRSAGFGELIGTDVRLGTILGRNSTVYIRVPFDVVDAARVASITLRMKYDDGFVAYVNGVEVARRNAPDDVAFNSSASETHPNDQATQFETIELPGVASLLNEGENVLAIQGLNLLFSDTDFLILPEIDIVIGGDLQNDSPEYFPTPSPGLPNGDGVTSIVADMSHTPATPSEDQPLTVLASAVTTTSEPVSLSLHYRVMYDAESELPMFDDGLHGDGAAGDGLFGATIPAGVATPGQMIRYYVTAEQAGENPSRWPTFVDPLDSPEYLGTVVLDPDVDGSNLPVMQLFMQDRFAADTDDGTRGSVFYGDEFYDNVQIDLHGRISKGFPRKSYDIDFNRSHRFKVSDDYPRAKDTNIVGNYLDPAKMRSTLVYEAFEWAGAGTHYSFPVRTEVNGNFFAVYDLVEDGDDRFLDRIGRSGGALYKMEGFLEDISGSIKKTRINNDFSDVQALTDGIKLEGDERKAFLYDNSNLPAIANFLASLVITSFNGCCVVNYYIYRDTLGTGEWEALPWDVNTSLGWTPSTHDELKTTDMLYAGPHNRYFAALYEDPDFNDMYLRRLRTLMDEIYGPPGSEGRFEQRIDELFDLLAPDAPADHRKMQVLDSRITQDWEHYVNVLRNGYLPGRREFLYNTQTVGNGGPIPEAQPDQVNLAFGTVEASPESSDQNEEYIELTNPNLFAVDVSEWQVTGAVNMTFKSGTVIPAGTTLYISPDVNAFRARTSGPSGGQGLFVQGAYSDRLSSDGGSLSVVDRSGRVAAFTQFEAEPTAAEQFLRVSEVMYNPSNFQFPSFDDNNDFEFIELRNSSDTTPISLSTVRINGGIQFDFAESNIRQLNPGEYVLVVKNQIAFEARYGNQLPVAGEFDGSLSNGGERILMDEGGKVILDFEYRDDWYPTTDGVGPSLVIVDPFAPTAQWNDASNWRPSNWSSGTPGTTDDRIVGDANGDNRFDSSDLVWVLQAGEYEDGIVGNSTFDEGDWNQDGEFDSADLVLAMQLGNFVHEAQLGSVAAAIDSIFSREDRDRR